MSSVRPIAPFDPVVIDYDRGNLALYAALMEAEDAGEPWQEAASSLMRLDVAASDAKACWRSHLDRARWIIGNGMEAAIEAFSKRPDRNAG